MQVGIDIIVFGLGFFVGIGFMMMKSKFTSGSLQTKQELNHCQQENAQLKQNWQDNLAAFRSVATNLHEMSQHIDNQIEDAEHILKDKKQTPAFPFFSKEATNILVSANGKPREKSNVDNQPLDYSGSASGVFKGATTLKPKEDDSI
jgi:uncharacterized membrane-anchored protein YhcB (DUF1043 family)